MSWRYIVYSERGISLVVRGMCTLGCCLVSSNASWKTERFYMMGGARAPSWILLIQKMLWALFANNRRLSVSSKLVSEMFTSWPELGLLSLSIPDKISDVQKWRELYLQASIVVDYDFGDLSAESFPSRARICCCLCWYKPIDNRKLRVFNRVCLLLHIHTYIHTYIHTLHYTFFFHVNIKAGPQILYA